MFISKIPFFGLKMINFAEFNLAVKFGWFRRIIFSDTNQMNLLEAELKTKITKIWIKGTKFTFINVIKNIVWKEVLNSCILVANTTRQENMNVPYPQTHLVPPKFEFYFSKTLLFYT